MPAWNDIAGRRKSTPPPKRRFPPQSKVPDINEAVPNRIVPPATLICLPSDAIHEAMDVNPHTGKVEKTHFLSTSAKWAIAICIVSLLGVIAVNRLTEGNLTTNRNPLVLVTATAVESAIHNFFTEYGKLPTAAARVTTDTPEGIRLLQVLLGTEAAGDGSQNPRSIKFLAVKSGEDKRNGLVYAADGKSLEGLFDPWGNPYTVEIDADYNELLEFQIGSKTVKLAGRSVAVHSPGPDRKPGTSDDVTTW
jgi:type II secretory pathway pseudopilin PulG